MKRIFLSCAVLSLCTIQAMAQSKSTRKPVVSANDNAAKNTTLVAAEPQSLTVRPVDPKTQDERIKEFALNKANAFKRQYNMDEKQFQAVYEASLDFTTKMEAIAAQGRQITNPEYEKLMAEHDGKLKKALTAQQYAKYEQTRIKTPQIN